MRESSGNQLPDVYLCFPVTLPATIMTSSIPTTVGGHMMYPSPHAVMYAPTSGLADGSLTVLNAFSQAPSTMQVSHSQVQEQGEGRVRAEDSRTISPFYRHSDVPSSNTEMHSPLLFMSLPNAHLYSCTNTQTWIFSHSLDNCTCSFGHSRTLKRSHYRHPHALHETLWGTHPLPHV